MTEPEPDYHLGVNGLANPAGSADAKETRPWVGIQFECCNVYARIYRNGDGTQYVGRCPRCLGQIRLTVGPGGTSARFFRAT